MTGMKPLQLLGHGARTWNTKSGLVHFGVRRAPGQSCRELLAIHARIRRGLDEARRTLYMSLVVGRARHHEGAELVATIVNSLVHHQSAVAVDEAVGHVATVVRGDMGVKANAGWKHRSSGAVRMSFSVTRGTSLSRASSRALLNASPTSAIAASSSNPLSSATDRLSAAMS
jgi:hypothetical protein